MATKNRIAACLWFDSEAEEAARFYTSVFKNAKIDRITHYTEAGQETHKRPPGSVMTVEFNLDGQQYTALNGGPAFKFNEAVSFEVHCDNQDEIDYYWDRLGENGDPKARQCGWLKDRYGLSWQIVPRMMGDLMSDSDPEQAGRVMNAMLTMKKLDIAALERAARNDK